MLRFVVYLEFCWCKSFLVLKFVVYLSFCWCKSQLCWVGCVSLGVVSYIL